MTQELEALIKPPSPVASNFANLEQVIAAALDLPIEAVNDDLTYHDVSEWDSLAHVRLILEIERQSNVKINMNVSWS